MSMDLISGVVVLTAVFLAVAGAVGLIGARSSGLTETSHQEWQRRGKMVLAVVMIVYFLSMTNVFIIAQQYNLAFVNLIVGVSLAVVQYLSGARGTEATSEAPDRPSAKGRDQQGGEP